MNTLFVLLLSLVSPPSTVPWGELTLSIDRDHSTSSDQATLCRVRVVNHGSRSWPGRSIAFEARALEGGTVVATERGRFGLTLAPYGTLETLIGFQGRYNRFEVVPAGGRTERKSRGGGDAPRRRKTRAPRD
ncbi:MAG TPA: hypothetical protein VFF17_15465 [Thermoanaerobaculia bacterium]|nr:hypothetical protein [Thermoanaerobaculia bacterium]